MSLGYKIKKKIRMSLEKGESSGSVEQRLQLEGPPHLTAVKALFKAAEIGNVEFLTNQSTEYLLSQNQEEGNCNIIHTAAKRLGSGIDQLDQKLVTFMREALKDMPTQAVLSLLCAKECLCGYTPLHYAAIRGCLQAVEFLVGIYNSRCQTSEGGGGGGEDCCPPWLMTSEFQDTPLHMALRSEDGERCASYLLKLDMKNLCNSINRDGDTPLSLAIKSGFDNVAQAILDSTCQYSLVGQDGFSLLHFAPGSSAKVCELLLERHSELLEDNNNAKGYSVLHKWAEVGKLWPLTLLLQLKKSSFIELAQSVDGQGRTPLHVAWMHGNKDFARLLWDSYEQTSREESPNLTDCCLWTMQDNNGNTPFHLALTNQHEDDKFLLKILSENPSIVHICNHAGESPLFIAVHVGQVGVVSKILELPDPELIGMPLRKDGCTVLHIMFSCEEKTGRLLVEKFWWLMHVVDRGGETALHAAKRANVLWAEKLLSSQINVPYAIKGAEFDWIRASKGGHRLALLVFISHCPDFLKICYKRKDTPLHHIKLETFDEYEDFLADKLVKKMKNVCDHDGATPLHRALERKDILLAEALLIIDGGVDMSIKDRNNKTARDLLAALCGQHHEWTEMCERNHIYPGLRPKYVQFKITDLAEMRQTLSVVAALLATLTFAAGFTIPGGFDSKSGEAIVAKKPSFVVFIIADTIAMCSALLALFCLIWSMVCHDREKSVILVDHSVVILKVALYGTLLAFMTGVFTVIYPDSWWTAIVIFIICLFVGISVSKTLLFKVLNKLIPTVP